MTTSDGNERQQQATTARNDSLPRQRAMIASEQRQRATTTSDLTKRATAAKERRRMDQPGTGSIQDWIGSRMDQFRIRFKLRIGSTQVSDCLNSSYGLAQLCLRFLVSLQKARLLFGSCESSWIPAHHFASSSVGLKGYSALDRLSERLLLVGSQDFRASLSCVFFTNGHDGLLAQVWTSASSSLLPKWVSTPCGVRGQPRLLHSLAWLGHKQLPVNDKWELHHYASDRIYHGTVKISTKKVPSLGRNRRGKVYRVRRQMR